MRGTSLISIGIVLLIAALALIFLLPDRQPVPPAGIESAGSPGSESTGSDSPGSAAPSNDVGNSHPAKTLQPMSVGENSDSTSPDIARLPVAESTTASPGPDENRPVRGRLNFPTWPEPTLALIVTGEQLGYFEPCGCSANQLGGMTRRATLVDRLTALGWTVRGVDLGSLSRRSARQSQMKFETTLQALRELQYVAVGLGPEELRLDPGYLISQHVTDGEQPLAFLSANLTFYGVPDLGTPLPFRVFEANGLTVGVTSVMSESRKKEVIPDRTAQQAEGADIQWQDPVAALKLVEAQFQAQNVDFRILLSQSTVAEARDFAQQFPGFDVVVSAGGYGDGEQKPELIGSTQLLQVGEKGKYAGVVGIYPQDPQQPVRFELVTLSGESFDDSAKMVSLMQAYQDRLKDERLVATESPVSHPSGARFVGAERCGECHTRAYEIWQNTPHAHAFDSLDPVHQREGYERLNGVIRTHDPECLACHVTGWDPQEYVRFRSGFLNEDMANTDDEKLLQSLLANNQCENCHGPGSLHIEQIEAGNLEAARPLVRAVLQESSCVKCHDGENSPDFNFEEYWEEVKHEGLD